MALNFHLSKDFFFFSNLGVAMASASPLVLPGGISLFHPIDAVQIDEHHSHAITAHNHLMLLRLRVWFPSVGVISLMACLRGNNFSNMCDPPTINPTPHIH